VSIPYLSPTGETLWDTELIKASIQFGRRCRHRSYNLTDTLVWFVWGFAELVHPLVELSQISIRHVDLATAKAALTGHPELTGATQTDSCNTCNF